MTPWSDEELAVADLPIPANEAAAMLGHSRSQRDIAVQRDRRLYDPDRATARVVFNIAKYDLGDHKRSWRYTGEGYLALDEACERGLVRRVGKSTYKATLAGLLYLDKKYGDRWRKAVAT